MRKLLKWSFSGLPFIILSLLIVLAFFQLPAADDFVGSYFVKKLGLGGAIGSFLANGTGRYFSIPLYMLATSCRPLMDHYYFVIPLFFLLLTYANIYSLVKWAFAEFFEVSLSVPGKNWLTALLLLVFFTSVPELSTFLFWLTTCIVYLLSFNFFLFFLRSLFGLLMATTEKAKRRQTLKLLVWVIIMSGSVEVILFFSLLASSLAMLYHVLAQKKIHAWLLGVIIVQVLLGAVVFLMPGNLEQTSGFGVKQSVIFSLASAVYQAAGMLRGIFSNILFWVAFIACISSFGFLKPSVQQQIAKKKLSFPVELLMLFAAIVFFYFFIRHLGGRVVPERADNLIACCMVTGLLWVGLVNSHLFAPVAGLLRRQVNAARNVMMILLLLVLLFNPFMTGLLQSLITAPFHLAVQKERLDAIEMAKKENKRTVVMEPYQQQFKEIVEARYSPKISAFMFAEFSSRPRYLYFDDAPVSKWSGHTYSEYYGIDTIVCGNNVVVRWGLSGTGLWDLIK